MVTSSWGGDSQYRLAAGVLQWSVNAMSPGVNSYRVRIRSEESFEDFVQLAMLFVKDCDIPTFSGHVESMQAAVKSQETTNRRTFCISNSLLP
jgi:hypothetical protein